MKKYKIIKTYPGSDKLGTVITLDKNGECWSTPQLVIESDCKNNPEFFEEIIEKEYQILKIKTNSTRICDCIDYGNEYVTALLNSEHTSIYSIKRLSDNEVFSINDKVTHPCGETYTIKSFKISNIDNNPDIVTEKGTYGLLGLCIRKAKPVLFVTEDGVGINVGDKYFELITPEFHNKPCIWNILEYTGRPNLIYDQESNRKNGRLWFSTKEKAQEFIILNKPVLSINDVLNAGYGICNPACLKELVKSRL